MGCGASKQNESRIYHQLSIAHLKLSIVRTSSKIVALFNRLISAYRLFTLTN